MTAASVPHRIPDDVAIGEPYLDELICTTCEGEGAVVWCKRVSGIAVHPLREREEWLCSNSYGDTLRRGNPGHPWGVDTCPECGRGGEVGAGGCIPCCIHSLFSGLKRQPNPSLTRADGFPGYQSHNAGGERV